MNAVLFTMDFEPITVIDLPMWAHEIALKAGRFYVEVLEPPKVYQAISIQYLIPKMVVIKAERLIWLDKSEKIIYVTANEESALLLGSSFLPGQEKDVQERENRAFAKGMLAMLERMR